MIQGNCYAVECADIEGCQVKRAKPSAYNPTVAYVYRGNGRPIGGKRGLLQLYDIYALMA